MPPCYAEPGCLGADQSPGFPSFLRGCRVNQSPVPPHSSGSRPISCALPHTCTFSLCPPEPGRSPCDLQPAPVKILLEGRGLSPVSSCQEKQEDGRAHFRSSAHPLRPLPRARRT